MEHRNQAVVRPFTPGNKRELRLDEALGVLSFRTLIFAWERHRRRDGSENINYHIGRGHYSRLSDFGVYLEYNAFFHVASILLLLLYFVESVLLKYTSPVLVVFVVLLMLFNIWCLMLQRYTALRIRRILYGRSQKRDRLLAAYRCLTDGEAHCAGDSAFLQRILFSLESGELLRLDSGDCPQMNALRGAAARQPDAGPGRRRFVDPFPLDRSLSEMRTKRVLIGPRERKTERRAAALRSLLHGNETWRGGIGCVIYTDSAETENAFRCLFPSADKESVTERILFLTAAFSGDDEPEERTKSAK